MSTDSNTDKTTPSNQYAESLLQPVDPHPDRARALPPPQRVHPAVRITAILIVVIVIVGIVYRLIGRAADQRHLESTTIRDAVPTVQIGRAHV